MAGRTKGGDAERHPSDDQESNSSSDSPPIQQELSRSNPRVTEIYLQSLGLEQDRPPIKRIRVNRKEWEKQKAAEEAEREKERREKIRRLENDRVLTQLRKEDEYERNAARRKDLGLELKKSKWGKYYTKRKK